MRIMARSVWNLLVFLLNCLVFTLIGCRSTGWCAAWGHFPPALLAAIAITVTGVAIAVRFAWVFPWPTCRSGLSGKLHDSTHGSTSAS
jgi:CPA1 family monovalent cation:H+ antiporter